MLDFLESVAGMGVKAQPATSILVQTVCIKVLRVARWRSRIRRAAAKVTHPDRGREFETRCAVKGLLFSNFCIDLYGYVYSCRCLFFFLRIDGFLSSVFFCVVFKLID